MKIRIEIPGAKAELEVENQFAGRTFCELVTGIMNAEARRAEIRAERENLAAEADGMEQGLAYTE